MEYVRQWVEGKRPPVQVATGDTTMCASGVLTLAYIRILHTYVYYIHIIYTHNVVHTIWNIKLVKAKVSVYVCTCVQL